MTSPPSSRPGNAPPCETGTAPARFVRHGAAEGGAEGGAPLVRAVPLEAPVSVEVNGIGLAVMMATPLALEDFAVGFARSEGLLGEMPELEGVDVHEVPAGHVVRLWLRGAGADRIAERARSRLTESACGLCGLASLEAAMRPLPPLARPLRVGPDALFRALATLPDHQALGRGTGATHAAALCDAGGAIRLVREDVGRHNALDKLVGAALRGGIDTAAHFALVTSRLSFELVDKAVRAPLGALAAISAPTALALERAAAAGLPVIALARADAALWAEVPSRFPDRG